MQDRVVRRYSLCFKRQVILDLEEGRFASITAVGKHYGITGGATVKNWLKQYGKNHLLAKVVRVETPNEADQIRQLRDEIKRLERALGQTQAQKILEEEYLKIACEELGQDVVTFKKNTAGKQSTEPSKKRP